MKNGELPNGIPGTAYPERLKDYLDLQNEVYTRPAELVSYMQGTGPNGRPNVEIKIEEAGYNVRGVYFEETAHIAFGSSYSSVKLPSYLNDAQKQALIEWRLYGAWVYHGKPS